MFNYWWVKIIIEISLIVYAGIIVRKIHEKTITEAEMKPIFYTVVTVILIVIVLEMSTGAKTLKFKVLDNQVEIELEEAVKRSYATVEVFNNMIEQMAGLMAFSVSRVGRLADSDLTTRLIAKRKAIVQCLNEIQSQKINAILEEIDEAIKTDLRYDLKASMQERCEAKKIAIDTKMLDKISEDFLNRTFDEKKRNEILNNIDNFSKMAGKGYEANENVISTIRKGLPQGPPYSDSVSSITSYIENLGINDSELKFFINSIEDFAKSN